MSQSNLFSDPELAWLALDSLDTALLICDRKGIIQYANATWLQHCGYTFNELAGQPCRLLLPEQIQRNHWRLPWKKIRKGERWEGDLLTRHKGGELHWQYLHIHPLLKNNQHFFLVSASDLSQLRASQQRVEWLSAFDSLTGLPNRASFLSRLKAQIRASSREPKPLMLIHLDIDHFSAINERYGEEAGDSLLKELAIVLKDYIKQEDILARLSGDEFGLILHHSQTDSALSKLVENLLEVLGQKIPPLGPGIEITFSLGIACFPTDGQDADSLMFCAATAKQNAKQEGGNRFAFYHRQQQLSKAERLSLQGQLRRAIEQQELVLHYQPQVSLISGEVVGFESLVRWNHPERGLVPPMQFIPLAEESGLIIPMSEWILHTACQQMQSWSRQGIAPHRIAVNLSARHFHMNTLPRQIAVLLAQYQLNPYQLELELTESMMMRDTSTAISIVDQIKSLGVLLSLDDFGTGYSSLAYLSRLSIDALKIDQSFVKDITSSPVNASIVLATIAMAHKLGMRVIAEGVENEAQRIFLQRHACDEMQGFGFSRPLLAEQASLMLQNGTKMSLATSEDSNDRHPTLLLLDDEPNIINALRRLFRHEGYRIIACNSASEALEHLALHRVDIILSDQRMPEMTGVEFLSRVKELYPSIIRIVLSGYSDIATVTDAINKGAIYKFFTKPWDDETLREEIRHIFRNLRD